MEQTYIQTTAAREETARFMQRVYAWMGLGLIVSGGTAYTVAATPSLTTLFLGNGLVFGGLIVAELLLVIGLASLVERISAAMATALFFLYSFTTGLTLSVIFLAYELGSIGQIFFITAGMFGGLSIYGMTTKRDLTGMGQVLFMALIGLILASIVNLFVRNSMADFVLAMIGVVIFSGLTAYDTQKIRAHNIIGNEGTEQDHKESIMGALTLYLDFINLFLKLLRLFGKRK